MFGPGNISPFNITKGLAGGTAFDPDAQAWIDRMTIPTDTVKDAINDLIVDEKAAGTNNFSKWDYSLALNIGAINSLIDAKGKTGTANGGGTFGVPGYDLNGTNAYIDTNFNPATDGVNYTLNDGAIIIFIKTKSVVTRAAVGSIDGTGKLGYFENNSTTILGNLNCANQTFTVAPDDDSLFSVYRVDGTNIKLDKDGVNVGTEAEGVTSVPSRNIFLGALNNNGTAGFFHSGVLSFFLVTSGIGYDQAAGNTNIRKFLTAIGTLP